MVPWIVQEVQEEFAGEVIPSMGNGTEMAADAAQETQAGVRLATLKQVVLPQFREELPDPTADKDTSVSLEQHLTGQIAVANETTPVYVKHRQLLLSSLLGVPKVVDRRRPALVAGNFVSDIL